MNANYKTLVPRLSMNVFVLVGSVLAGCVQEDPQVRSKPPQEKLTAQPLVIAPSPEPDTAGATLQKFEVKTEGSKSEYVPKFENGQLVRITEERTTREGLARARYEFHGARLLRYSGSAFETDQQLDVEFNLQGVVISAMRDSQPASPQEIAQARAHAQLLRSHALAQQASRSHNMASQ
jgi:hypothetical protein